MPRISNKVAIDGRAVRLRRNGFAGKGQPRRPKITQKDLAHRVGISRSYLSELELGRKQPSEYVAVRLADALDMPVREVIPERPY